MIKVETSGTPVFNYRFYSQNGLLYHVRQEFEMTTIYLIDNILNFLCPKIFQKFFKNQN